MAQDRAAEGQHPVSPRSKHFDCFDTGIGHHVADMSAPPHPYLSQTVALRGVIGGLPLLTANRYQTLDHAETALEQGLDMVGMNRAQMANPDLIAKATSGRSGDIRPCVSGNYCIGQVAQHRPISCMMNTQSAWRTCWRMARMWWCWPPGRCLMPCPTARRSPWNGARVVIDDAAGSWATLSAAETLAARGGANVTVVCRPDSPLWDVTIYSRITALERLGQAGVALRPATLVTGHGPGTLARDPARRVLLIEAGAATGTPCCDHVNAPGAGGVGPYDFCIRNGRRVSAATSFLASRPNLHILTGAHVLRVVIENRRAFGVEVLHKSQRLFCGADEAVLSGGTVNSPQILMLSGIGPGDALRAHGIPVVADLPGVGRNLRNHLLVRVEHDCTEPVTLHGLLRP